MRQVAPDPEPLRELVGRLRYKEGLKFWLEDMDRGQGSEGLTLVIQRYGPDTYHPERMMRVNHYMIVPAAARSWQRWLLDRFLLVERHECCEFFRLDNSGDPDGMQGPGPAEIRPYAPSHGPGNDPYLIRETGTDLDRRTSFRGEISAS